MSKIKRLPDAELEIMNALWDADAPLTAAELETALPGPPRTYIKGVEPDGKRPDPASDDAASRYWKSKYADDRCKRCGSF